MAKPIKLPLWKKVAIGAVATVAGIVGSANAETKPVEKPAKPAYSTEIEAQYDAEKDEFISRFELLKGQDYVARIEKTQGKNGSRNRFGAKIPLKSDLFTGYLDVFGSNDGNGNSSGGINWDGVIYNKYIWGGALERSENGGVENKVENLYGGLDLGDISFTSGTASVKKGEDKRRVYHGTFFRKYGTFMAGAGGQTDNKQDHYAHFVVGQFPKDRGKGFGWRFYGMSELKGDVFADLILTWDSNFSKWSYYGAADRYVYFHEKKMRATDNIMDYFIPAVELFKRTNSVAALEFKFNKPEQGKNSLNIDSAFFPTGVARKFGANIDKSILDKIWIGGGYDTLNERSTLKAGVKHKNLIVYGTKTEGREPVIFTGLYGRF